jgi:Protein of unknown function (DUF1036)
MGRPVVEFENATGAKIFVAYSPMDPDCGSACGYPWITCGWVVLDPGETETRPNPTKNTWFYYYAEDVNGNVWNGPFVAEVTDAAFCKCDCYPVNGNLYYDVGFDELDTDTYSGVRFII